MSNPDPTSRQHQAETFIAELERLDAAGRARLKRNAGRTLGEARQIHQVFFQALPIGLDKRHLDDYFLIATLFPLVPQRAGTGSLAAALRRVRQRRSDSGRTNSLDRRFQTLLDSERVQLPFRLRQAVRLIAAEDLSLDWTLLLRNLLAWEREGRPVQLGWARDYFVGRPEPSQNPLA